jgi:hypothetical protein
MVWRIVGLDSFRGIGLSRWEPFEATLMVIFTFASSKKPRPFAFAADQSSRHLPDRHGPWKLTGRVNSDAAIPHDLDRAMVKDALGETGFQLWRLRKGS